MAEAAAASGAGDKSEGSPEKTIVYAASGGRKTFFSFVFLILLPFFISLPAMFFMRIKHGLFFDADRPRDHGDGVLDPDAARLDRASGLDPDARRARPDKVKMTLPSGRGPTPMLFYKTHEIPYDQVQSVETRREIYGGSLVPVLLKGARIITKDGKSIPIGYVSEANVDPGISLPRDRQEDRRAGAAAAHRSRQRAPLVPAQVSSGSSRAASTRSTPSTRRRSRRSTRATTTWCMGLVSALVVLIGIGIVHDLVGDTPIGQTASAIVVPAGQGAGEEVAAAVS